MKVKVSVTQSCPTLCDSVDCSQWKSPRKNTGVGCRSLLQGIFLTQGSIPGLLHCREILHHLSHQGNPYIVSLLSAILTISLHSVAQGGGVFPGLSTQRRVPGPSLSHLSPGGGDLPDSEEQSLQAKGSESQSPTSWLWRKVTVLRRSTEQIFRVWGKFHFLPGPRGSQAPTGPWLESRTDTEMSQGDWNRGRGRGPCLWQPS